MKLAAPNTLSETYRFLSPQGGDGLICHESIDLSTLPGVEHVGGRNSFAIIETADGSEQACQVEYHSGFSIPGGATIISVNEMSLENQRDHGWFSTVQDTARKSVASYFEGGTCSYNPHAEENEQANGVQAIVQVDTMFLLRDGIKDPRFNEKGFGIVSVNDPLPNFERRGEHSESTAYFKLLGFITPNDKLVVVGEPTSMASELVDTCVAYALSRNAAEMTYVRRSFRGSLKGSLASNPVAKLYLDYWDATHAGEGFPKMTPTEDFLDFENPELGEDDYTALEALRRLALDYSVVAD